MEAPQDVGGARHSTAVVACNCNVYLFQEEIKSSGNTRDVLCARMLHGLSYEQLFESMLGDTGFVIVCVLTIAVTFGGLVA